MIFWIASYPKNGNTWLRSLLSAYYFTEDGNFKNDKILKNIPQFPEKKYFVNFEYDKSNPVSTARYWIKAQEMINIDKKIKFLKTHNIYGALNGNEFSNRSNSIGGIYIIRDPRNVITSLMNHFEMNKEDALKFMLSEKKFIYDFFKKNDFSDFQFISSWAKNYKSWINNKDFPIKLIKYEDLIKDTFFVVKDLINFIDDTSKTNYKFNKSKAQNAIQTTNFENLKNIEKNYGFSESIKSKNKDNKIPFFHLGPNNKWQNFFDNDFANKLNVIFKESLKELQYN
tara:strand:+ start:2457 stop:3308 length:852 start_codon:yes stop_codon:yes gene_type:complete